MTPAEKAGVLWGASEERKRVVALLRRLADEAPSGTYRDEAMGLIGAVGALREAAKLIEQGTVL